MQIETQIPRERHRSRSVVAAMLFAGLAASACGGATAPRADLARDLPGTWSAPFAIAGSGETWTLSVTGTAVMGTGWWSGEARGAGPVSITGVLRGDSLHLD